MTSYVKICPDCKSERPQFELICEAVREEGLRCEFPLIEVAALPRSMAEETRPPPTPPVGPGEAVAGGANGEGSADQPAAPQPVAAPAIATDGACAACHAPVEPDDAVCISCGAALGPAARELEFARGGGGDVVNTEDAVLTEASKGAVARVPSDAAIAPAVGRKRDDFIFN